MIANQDRSNWFGASDTSTIMQSWNTKSFIDWWMIKLGYDIPRVRTLAMDVGNIMEIPIIHAIEHIEGRNIKLGKRPFYDRKLKLRVNVDGMTPESVIEIKTTKDGFQKPPMQYWRQAQVLMYATRRNVCELYSYKLTEADYIAPYFPDIDPSRLTRFDIPYNPEWINGEYFPRIKTLVRFLKERGFPDVKPD